MRQKNEKKLLSFINYSLIDKMLKDISLLEGKNESLIAEEILLGYREPLLPPSKTASFIVRNFYYADDAVTLMYASSFEQISTLINGHYIPRKKKSSLIACTTPSVDLKHHTAHHLHAQKSSAWSGTLNSSPLLSSIWKWYIITCRSLI